MVGPSHSSSTRRATWFTTSEAAELLGITERAIQLRARRGTIDHRRTRSPETGRIRLLVTSSELEELASGGGRRGTAEGRDFIPRFHQNPMEEDSVEQDEWSALTADLESLDQGLWQDRRRELTTERDRLARELRREQEQSASQERSLHRFIDRQKTDHRIKEERLRKQVTGLARNLGQVEHQLLLLESRPAWWRRLLSALLPARRPASPRRRRRRS